MASTEEAERQSLYPDSSRSNRRPPVLRSMPHEIQCKSDVKVIGISGEYVCASATVTKIWSVTSGVCFGQISHSDYRVTAIGFKPSVKVSDEGKVIWLGTRDGILFEIDITRLKITNRRVGVHSASIKGIYRCGYEMWTLDDDGRLQVWGPDDISGLPNLSDTPRTQRVPSLTQYAIVVDKQLWVGRNKQVTVYQPSFSQNEQFVISRPMSAIKQVGEITCAAVIATNPDYIYVGHDDGKVSVYSCSKLVCINVVNISLYKIMGMVGVGKYLWITFRTGMIYVYDTSQNPWVVMKDWKAHEGAIYSVAVDRTSIFKLGILPVLTVSPSMSSVAIWDGMLKQDWLELNMQEHDADYCSFRSAQALICTWNVGAAKPSDLQSTASDAKFLRKLLATADDPEIIVFGFQELVELDNKTMTAKSMFKHKKKSKDSSNLKQHMSHQYREWEEKLTVAISHLRSEYTLLGSEKLVGLYSCVFVKKSEVKNIGNLRSSVVKTGLGGLHGNKGAIIIRFTLDNSSLCFVNCHLAAGHSHIIPRNNDIATILESKIAVGGIGSTAKLSDLFVGGGDGSMILDHEICFVNGDMNYRINLHRETVMKMLESDSIDRLLEADQLLTQLKKNPAFRLRPFTESVITFQPTYKYDIGSDNYDTSEKRRIPAWCDRIYFRGPGKIFPIEYRTHDVKISDHRPVSGVYDIKIKTVDAKLRDEALKQASKRWKAFVEESIETAKLHFYENEQRMN
ncbi:Endonuclease/exonuclease/phosphatase [Lipomyces arxii]|uniref:Endonuclease/exonuclease/phosphatase n=1 Tax=Lipomyces arxii TaxID=56418 RepID=UPI0034CE1184